jgi:hypothetical protein
LNIVRDIVRLVGLGPTREHEGWTENTHDGGDLQVLLGPMLLGPGRVCCCGERAHGGCAGIGARGCEHMAFRIRAARKRCIVCILWHASRVSRWPPSSHRCSSQRSWFRKWLSQAPG